MVDVRFVTVLDGAALRDRNRADLDEFAQRTVDGIGGRPHIVGEPGPGGVSGSRIAVGVLRAEDGEQADGLTADAGIEQPLGHHAPAPDVRRDYVFRHRDSR